MKTLEQLGISPAPWSFVKSNRDYEVSDSEDFGLSYEDRYELPDARLIAAAPDLYEALASMLSCAEKEAPFTAESGMSIAMDMARKAIKKAGGELVSSLEDWMKKYPPSEFSTFGQAYQLLVEAVNNFRTALAKAARESEVKE